MSSENIEEIGRGAVTLSAETPHSGAHPAGCPVVGLGASAGGLEAFQSFIGAVSPDAGLAYVLVQHLDPNHESMLAELLSRRTALPVRQITDGMAVEPNNIYLIPPNASLIIDKARLRLTDFTEPRGFRRPIDVFFRSLAVDQGANAACAVLSGTGADGSDGLRAIKEAGGLAIVQNPESAKYDGMPKSAVGTGLVDKVLDVNEMPSCLQEYFERAQSGALSVADVNDFVLAVCAQLRRRLGHDFSQYKRSTMLRRIQRRMQVVGATTSEDYLKRLQEHDLEADLLFRDLLINVTCFFRDTESFDYLRREVIPAILAEKGAHDTVRIWTAGCSSGEEAYSIAILLAEALSLQRVQPNVQVFATDIDEPMLQKARSARYPHATVKDVPIELLDRYFYAEGEEYVLSQSIRDTVRVSNHNLLKDPPFSRIDLLICRNLLIYLNSALQQRLMPVFHYALRPQGWLFLGSAENIGGRNDLFETVDSPSRVYRRKGLHRLSVPMPLSLDAVGAVDIDHDRTRRTVREGLDPVSRRIMDRYAPVHVIVNPDNHVVRASSRTGKYLELATGAPSNNVTDLAKRGLRPALRSLLETVRKTGRRTMKRDLPMEGEDDKVSLVDVTADPLTDDEILLVFQDAGEMRRETDGADDVDIGGFADEERARQLEDELDQTRLRLRTTVEELETSNEELKSSNEEMMSMNEELQSTNEELATVNEELNNKVDQLARANSDLENFIESTQVPTIFLDQKLQIRSFTPATKSLFRFQEQDRGRAFSDVASRLDQKELEDLSRKVLETGKAQEKEYDLDTGESYVLRILPYVDSSGGVTGVVLVFADVSKIRQTQADLARNVEITRHRNKEIVRLYETAPVGMALIDRNNRFLKVNERFADFVGRDVESHVGRTIRDIQPAFAERMEGCIAEVFEHKREVTNVDITARLDGEHAQDFLIDFFPYDEDDQTMAVGVIVKEVTEVKRLEREARRLMDELQHRVKNTLATVLSIINQTVKTKADKQDLVDALKNRIGALAATHDLLTQADWRSVPLQSIIDAELRPFDHQDRITLRGPTVMLPPKHALCITLTLHELATNAAKYGALAHPAGKLDLEWSVKVDDTGQRLTLHWTETGVHVAKKAPKDSFGAKLIRNAVKHDLKGQCDYRLAEDGVKCAISFSF